MDIKTEFKKIDNIFKSAKHIHFIGIGGTSMSGLALYIKTMDSSLEVTGSDRAKNDYTDRLEKNDIKVFVGQKAENVKGADLIIYTAAIAENNPERTAAAELNIPIFERAVMLGYLMDKYKNSIGISGTHGKTTTTSLTACCMLEAGMDPGIMIGASLPNIDGNSRCGAFEYSVFEACEFVDSFLHFYPKIAVILNIEEDHLDYFKNLDNIKKSFAKYISHTGKDGYCVINKDSKNATDILNGYEGKVITFAISEKDADYTAQNIVFGNFGNSKFDVYEHGEFLMQATLAISGLHNVSNALAAIASCRILGMDTSSIAKGLASYHGACRRFELVGTGKTGFKVYDDYAHHPTEVKSVLDVAKTLKCDKFWLIHQPHTFTRTKLLFDDWVELLSKVDNLIITDICAAREEDIYGIHSEDLIAKLPNAHLCKTFEDVKNFCEANLTENDIAMTVGCGDIYLAARLMCE